MAVPKAGSYHATRRKTFEAGVLSEDDLVGQLLEDTRLSPEQGGLVDDLARRMVTVARQQRPSGDLEEFLQEFQLSTPEGAALMTMAEALLRIPDVKTADTFIREKLTSANWDTHLGHSGSKLVNASAWALMVSGRMMRLEEPAGTVLWRLVSRVGEPLVRKALIRAFHLMGRQFVMGHTIGDAMERAKAQPRYRYSYDMLGEAARTADDAVRYFHDYAQAIGVIGANGGGHDPESRPGLSVKLSALHPRYDYSQRERVMAELAPRLLELARLARGVNIGLTVDAEEADQLDLSLDVMEYVLADPTLVGWNGLGLAVQAYQKRARAVIAWAADQARTRRRRLTVRLVKGAYWDSEIKRAQERGLAGYPVFTHKAATDISYLACVHDLLAAGGYLYSAFATHNARTIASIRVLAGGRTGWEFQRLHGMGEALYDQVVRDVPVRVYAPVGSYDSLVPYLVRRLLENGANTSFVNQLADDKISAEDLVRDPVEAWADRHATGVRELPLPAEIFGQERLNSNGLDLSDDMRVEDLRAALTEASTHAAVAVPLVAGHEIMTAQPIDLVDPADNSRIVGSVREACAEDAAAAVMRAVDGQANWDRRGGVERAAILERAADLYERSRPELAYLIIREAGKTIADAIAEIREAIDFLRYYAAIGRDVFGSARQLGGVTGESNYLSLHGRGVFACISPWNFPLAIFTGQVAAALMAGNAAVAKPAEQTPLVAAAAVRLLHQAGVPPEILSFLPGDGIVGQSLAEHPDIAGVAFTGSTEVARRLARVLAAKDGPIVPLIAETGGINAMIVDSSALPEQVVADVLQSAFGSAGQRCSALRMLFVQNEAADRVLPMLAGAMAELKIGDPMALSTDVGPVIDRGAQGALRDHGERMARVAKCLAITPIPQGLENGSFFAPRAYLLDTPYDLGREVFGPILHVVRFSTGRLDDIVRWIRHCGYGLTLGVHSRIDSMVERIRGQVRVGNIYVNRGMTGAIVGVQPFGGEGLSGTGPKAGGPNTLFRFATERVITVNTTAVGGNTALMHGTRIDDEV